MSADLMAKLATSCACCGMPCDPGEYHPYAACLMFNACGNSQAVYSNLQEVKDYALRTYHAELEAMARDVERYQFLRDDDCPVDFTELRRCEGEDMDEMVDAAMQSARAE